MDRPGITRWRPSAPTEVVKAFSLPGVEDVAREVEEVLLRMMTEAAAQH